MATFPTRKWIACCADILPLNWRSASKPGRFQKVIVAPAFPAQGRLTRGGTQYSRNSASSSWAAVGPDFVQRLREVGLTAVSAAPEKLPGDGVTVYDAETDADLERIAAHMHADCADPSTVL